MSPRAHYFVKDFMSTRGVTMASGTTFRHATELMLKEKTNGVVVTSAQNKVIGIISSWDLIRHVVPDYLEDEQNLASFEAETVFARRVLEVADTPIDKFMTQNVHTVRPTDSLMEAAALLAKHGIRQLPVVDENEVFIGYINRTDIKKAIGDVFGLSFEN